jgi:hypothetical protein
MNTTDYLKKKQARTVLRGSLFAKMLLIIIDYLPFGYVISGLSTVSVR